MDEVEKVAISLTPQQAELLREAVSSGAYASSSAIIDEALADWTAKWTSRQQDVQQLRDLWAAGQASGSELDVDLDDMLQEARNDLKALQKNAS